MKCFNCSKEGAYNIADGLDLCPKCESNERFNLVQNTTTKEIYWKNTYWCVLDDEIILKN